MARTMEDETTRVARHGTKGARHAAQAAQRCVDPLKAQNHLIGVLMSECRLAFLNGHRQNFMTTQGRRVNRNTVPHLSPRQELLGHLNLVDLTHASFAVSNRRIVAWVVDLPGLTGMPFQKSGQKRARTAR